MDKVRIFDTTLRDGEQSPGASLDISEKLEIARMLSRLGVDVIEAGFPVSSPVQFEAANLIAREIDGPIIAGLARTVKHDIDVCWDAIKVNQNPMIHVFVATSDIHLNAKFRKKSGQDFSESMEDVRARILETAVDHVRYAKSLCNLVEFSAEDAGRTNLSYLTEVIEAVIEAGADVVNIPDTTGYCLPWEYAEIISYLKKNVKNIEQAIISVHCHDDLGLAVANSLSAIQVGARQIECTVNGIGERAGNCSLEEVVMAIKTRANGFGELSHNIDTTFIYPISQLVSNLSGLEIQRNKAIIGKNAFAHEAGIHQHGIIQDRQTYEIMNPEDIGLNPNRIILGRHSGKHGVRSRLEQLGYHLNKEQFDKVFEIFSKVADKKKEVSDEELSAIVGDLFFENKEIYTLDHLQVFSGTGIIPSATVRIKYGEEVFTAACSGDGPVDAACQAIQQAIGIKVNLKQYRIDAKSKGTDSIGEVLILISENGHNFAGRGSSTDIIEASALAFIRAINRMKS